MLERRLKLVYTSMWYLLVHSQIDKDGHEVTVTALQDKDGSIYTTISATINSSIDLLEDIIADEGCVEVVVNENKSNNGREFYQLQII